MTNLDIVTGKIGENYGKTTSSLSECNQLFDLNNDGIIDYKDLGIAGANTEADNGIIVDAYNKCSSSLSIVLIIIAVVGFYLVIRGK